MERNMWVGALAFLMLLGMGGGSEGGQGVWGVWSWLWLCHVGMLVLVDLQRPPRTLLWLMCLKLLLLRCQNWARDYGLGYVMKER